MLTAYRGMWDDLVTAARTSDYRSPGPADHATGDALTLFVQGLDRDQSTPPGGRRTTTAVVARHDGVWKVTDLTVGAVGTS